MPSLGLGAAPLGSVSLGYGAPARANSTSAKLFLDEKLVRRNAVHINPATGDVVRDPANGVHTGMDGVSQQVYLALRTLRGSAIVQGLGVAFNVKVINETTARKLEEEARRALSDLVTRRLVEVVSVTSARVKLTGVRVDVTWRNLTNNETNVSRWTNG